MRQFEPDLALALIEFGKSLCTIDADALMFMARKSLCLYDVLTRVGVPPAEQIILSDRVLDMRLDKLQGKKVALIDDTLIVGTTLAKTRRRLLEAGVKSVSTHAFCVDAKWWCHDLVKPDFAALHLTDDRVMTFCAAAVRAMSLVPRPYLVDFPLSRPLRVPAAEAQCFLSNIEWRAFNISTNLQRAHDVSSLSFFPNEDAEQALIQAVGPDVWSCIDIVKVRGFARKNTDVYWLQVLPIVVLKALKTASLDYILERVLVGIPELTDQDRSTLLYSANTPRARQRLLQYVLSCIVGHKFVRSMRDSLSRPVRFSFDMKETDRHYGPWLHDSMVAITAAEKIEKIHSESSPALAVASLPHKVLRWAASSLPKLENDTGGLPNLFRSDEIANVIPDFSEIFLAHYDSREIPARKEAKKLGAAVLDTVDAISPRNRLEIGLPWPIIVEHLVSLHNVERTSQLEQVFSLVLDFCNDQGIAVPVTCVVDDIVFRAYRHGEDVKFTDAEVALAFESIKGFLLSTNTKTVSKLKLEKLLVLLLKVGVARSFLEPLLMSSGGVQEVLRIGFYLRGAIPVLARGPRDRADRETWFSRYLIKRGVIQQGGKGQYQLGTAVDGNFRSTTAPDDAFELGSVLGLLSQARRDPKRKDAPLDDNALTLIASCGTPRHAAASIQVELDIFREWFETDGRPQLRKLPWTSPQAVKTVFKKLIVSNGHVAIHGTRLKYVGYIEDEPSQIIERCAEYLRSRHGELLQRKWTSYWKAVKTLEASGEKATFDSLIDEAARICWEAALWFSVIEVSLAKFLVDQNAGTEMLDYLQSALRKFDEYSRAMSATDLQIPPNKATVDNSIRALSQGYLAPSAVVSAFNAAIGELGGLLPRLSAQSAAMAPMIDEYGRLAGRRDYAFMLYYDIIDSTGTIAGRAGADLTWYRGRVRRLKEALNDGFRDLSRAAEKAASEVFCWNGDRKSTNDCKHVFVGGTSGLMFLQQTLAMLCHTMEAIPSIHLRIYVVPCNFVGTTAYRQEWDTEISGDRFWEHWSRLTKGAKAYEEAVGQGRSFLLVAVRELIDRLVVPQGWAWETAVEATISSEIELLAKKTDVRYGGLAKQTRLSKRPPPRY